MDEVTNVSKNVLANLSVDELEERLEMQIVSIPEADWCGIRFSCGTQTIS